MLAIYTIEIPNSIRVPVLPIYQRFVTAPGPWRLPKWLLKGETLYIKWLCNVDSIETDVVKPTWLVTDSVAARGIFNQWTHSESKRYDAIAYSSKAAPKIPDSFWRIHEIVTAHNAADVTLFIGATALLAQGLRVGRDYDIVSKSRRMITALKRTELKTDARYVPSAINTNLQKKLHISNAELYNSEAIHFRWFFGLKVLTPQYYFRPRLELRADPIVFADLHAYSDFCEHVEYPDYTFPRICGNWMDGYVIYNFSEDYDYEVNRFDQLFYSEYSCSDIVSEISIPKMFFDPETIELVNNIGLIEYKLQEGLDWGKDRIIRTYSRRDAAQI